MTLVEQKKTRIIYENDKNHYIGPTGADRDIA